MRCSKYVTEKSLLVAGIIICLCGVVLISLGLIMINPSHGFFAHLSLTYVGIGIFLSGLTIFINAIYRSFTMYKKLKKMNISMADFEVLWKQLVSEKSNNQFQFFQELDASSLLSESLSSLKEIDFFMSNPSLNIPFRRGHSGFPIPFQMADLSNYNSK